MKQMPANLYRVLRGPAETPRWCNRTWISWVRRRPRLLSRTVYSFISNHFVRISPFLPPSLPPFHLITAPEIQTLSSCCILSDMFSLGLVICAIFNHGRPLIQANNSTSAYLKQLELVSWMEMEGRMLNDRLISSLPSLDSWTMVFIICCPEFLFHSKRPLPDW